MDAADEQEVGRADGSDVAYGSRDMDGDLAMALVQSSKELVEEMAVMRRMEGAGGSGAVADGKQGAVAVEKWVV